MAIIIESPNEVYSVENNKNKKLFLAGGITNCADWQKEIIKELEDLPNLSIYNPRRESFDMDDASITQQQITWEYNKLQEADIILFWFAEGSINPIVLYELGRWGNSSDKQIIIGLHENYERSEDVMYQTLLSRDDVPIVHSMKAAIKKIKSLNTKL